MPEVIHINRKIDRLKKVIEAYNCKLIQERKKTLSSTNERVKDLEIALIECRDMLKDFLDMRNIGTTSRYQNQQIALFKELEEAKKV